MEYTPIWSGIIACYLFLGGLGGGAFATSAFLAWRHPEAVTMRKLGHWIAPIVVIVGLVLLMFDAKAGLHNPLRFALLLTNFGSVMTWGVVILAAFVIVALVALIMDLKKRRVPMALEIVGAVLGICVAIYTGCLLGVCKTFPLWNNALLPILFLVSAVSTGMAAVLLAGVFKCPEEFNRVGVLKKFHFCFPCIEMLLVAALLFITATNSTAGLASVQALVCGKYAVVFWVLFVAVGLVDPDGAGDQDAVLQPQGVRGVPQGPHDQRRLRHRRAGRRLRAAPSGAAGRAAGDHDGRLDALAARGAGRPAPRPSRGAGALPVRAPSPSGEGRPGRAPSLGAAASPGRRPPFPRPSPASPGGGPFCIWGGCPAAGPGRTLRGRFGGRGLICPGFARGEVLRPARRARTLWGRSAKRPTVGRMTLRPLSVRLKHPGWT